MDDFMEVSDVPFAQYQVSIRSESLADVLFTKLFADEIHSTQEKDNQSDLLSSQVPLTTRMKTIYYFLSQEAENEPSQILWSPEGIIRSDIINFNSKMFTGNIVIDKKPRIELRTEDNFATAVADACVYAGKWQYEVQILTSGVMQIGWTALQGSKFTKQKGVGDTSDSYAYDGHRKRRWNVNSDKYGDSWTDGDIITCTIDMEKGEIAYLRNGRSLGVAFSNVKIGPNYAYFPAISLTSFEVLNVNFGGAPFHYPQCGFHPLQPPPCYLKTVSNAVLGYMDRLVDIVLNWDEDEDLKGFVGGKKDISIMLMAHHVGKKLAPMICSCPYLIEDVFLKYIINLYCSTELHPNLLVKAHKLFDFIYATFEEPEVLCLLENVICCLKFRFQQPPQDINLTNQIYNLEILCIFLSHEKFRKFCLRNILFCDNRLISFLCINMIDSSQMNELKIERFWFTRDKCIRGDEKAFLNSVSTIEHGASDLECHQVKVLELLLNAKDGHPFRLTSRYLFLEKFRQFIRNPNVFSRAHITPYLILNMVERLYKAFIYIGYDAFGTEFCKDSLPPSLFYEGSLNYYETPRLGGLLSYLKKVFAEERLKAIKEAKTKKLIISLESVSSIDETRSSSSNVDSSTGLSDSVDTSSYVETNKLISRVSLFHLLDGIIFLFNMGGHKMLDKLHSQMDNIFENASYYVNLLECRDKLLKENCPQYVVNDYNKSIEVFEKKLDELVNVYAWLSATTFSSKFIECLHSLSLLVSGVLWNASSEGPLFAFVPDFYVEALCKLFSSIRRIFTYKEIAKSDEMDEGLPFTLSKIGGISVSETYTLRYYELLKSVSHFTAVHFSDARIVTADSKDALIQNLASIVCYKPGLLALEDAPLRNQMCMIYMLLRPYENRAWAQSNWVLVRFWKGLGFGFRFHKSPHLINRLTPRPFSDTASVHSFAPCPSKVFLRRIMEAFTDSADLFSSFINSFLNQLNWSFSEFIGMLQEIQNASNRPEKIFIESRQLRVCVTCFDLALALLRVLEALVNYNFHLFLDGSQPHRKLLVSRLCQLLCHVLNRVSVNSGCFSHVVNLQITGLDSIHYYPTLTAVVGILTSLMKIEIYPDPKYMPPENIISPTRILLDEASFQMSSLYSLIDGKDVLNPALREECQRSNAQQGPLCISYPSKEEPTEDNCKDVEDCFIKSCTCNTPSLCLRNYPKDVLPFEIKKLVDLILHLEKWSSLLPSSSGRSEENENYCIICYAKEATAKFYPCNHSSCVTCITHHLMNKEDCFFCKSSIKKVIDSSDGNTVFDSEKS